MSTRKIIEETYNFFDRIMTLRIVNELQDDDVDKLDDVLNSLRKELEKSHSGQAPYAYEVMGGLVFKGDYITKNKDEITTFLACGRKLKPLYDNQQS